MFENLLGQQLVKEQLISDIKGNCLPQSLLFEGSDYGGKMTAALELARILTCLEGSAAWNCDCRHCIQQRLLVQPFVMISGSRYFLEEIKAAGNLLLDLDTPSVRYLFIRNVRKLLKRFDPVLHESGDSKIKKLGKDVQTLNEIMQSWAPGNELPGEKKIAKEMEKIYQICTTLAKSVSSHIPIQQVRSLSAWAHVTAENSCKVVILENADAMQESARNSLLKLLEEPPAGLYLILLTSRKRVILPTILSRVRPYHFRERNVSVASEILDRVYRSPAREEGLRAYFHSFRPEKKEGELDPLAFLKAAGQRKPFDEKWTSGLVSSDFQIFLEDLCGELSRIGRLKEQSSRWLGRMDVYMKEINAARFNAETYNMNPGFLLESLYYKLGGYRSGSGGGSFS